MDFHSIFVVLFTFVRMWIMTFFLLSGNEHAEYSSWVQINFALSDRWVQTKKVTTRFFWLIFGLSPEFRTQRQSERKTKPKKWHDRPTLDGWAVRPTFHISKCMVQKTQPGGFLGFLLGFGFYCVFRVFLKL